MSEKNSAPDNRGRFKFAFLLARFGVSETQKEQMHDETF